MSDNNQSKQINTEQKVNQENKQVNEENKQVNQETKDGAIESVESIDTETVKPKNKNDYKCAPAIKFNSGSCIDLPVLIEMAKAYNESNTRKIKLHPKLHTLNPKKYKKYLLKEFQDRYKNVCDTQFCWTQQDFVDKMNSIMRDELTKFTYRPQGPKGKFEWLNTTHLNEVMEQYQKVHKDFKFLGAVPIDFQEIKQESIHDIDINKLKKDNITKIGVVFNLDKHNQSGSHWVALYGNLEDNNGKVYFFDSYGSRPPEEVRAFMDKLRVQYENSFHKKCDVNYNRVRNQFKNSECGVYSINFILEMLKGKTLKEIEENPIPDDDINMLRNKIFRNVEIKK